MIDLDLQRGLDLFACSFGKYCGERESVRVHDNSIKRSYQARKIEGRRQILHRSTLNAANNR